MAVQLGSKMRPFIDDVIKVIKDHLRQRGSVTLPSPCYPIANAEPSIRRKNAPFEAPIFQCLAMLTSSVGPMLNRQMHEVLDLMFPWGLSEALFHALEVIGAHIPPLLKIIQGESERVTSLCDADVQNVCWTPYQ